MAGHRLGALEGGGGVPPPSNASLGGGGGPGGGGGGVGSLHLRLSAVLTQRWVAVISWCPYGCSTTHRDPHGGCWSHVAGSLEPLKPPESLFVRRCPPVGALRRAQSVPTWLPMASHVLPLSPKERQPKAKGRLPERLQKRLSAACKAFVWQLLPRTTRWAGRCPAPAWVHSRLAPSVCRLRQERMGQGLTEPHAGRGTFLLSSGGAGGGYY